MRLSVNLGPDDSQSSEAPLKTSLNIISVVILLNVSVCEIQLSFLVNYAKTVVRFTIDIFFSVFEKSSFTEDKI